MPPVLPPASAPAPSETAPSAAANFETAGPETAGPETEGAGNTAPETERRNFYGRIHGKTLRSSQKAYLAEDLGPLTLHGLTREDNPARTPLDPAQISNRPIWVEIGFGGGEHMVHMAAAYPDIHLIGAEPFVNGIAMLLGKIRHAGVGNLHIHPGDVRDLFDVLPPACIARAFLNYPDPWPKARHHRRRFVTPGYLGQLARVLQQGAEFRIASDIPDYIRQAREQVPQAGFDPVRDSAQPWDDWVSTRYEQKALREGRAPHYLTYRRAAPQP